MPRTTLLGAAGRRIRDELQCLRRWCELDYAGDLCAGAYRHAFDPLIASVQVLGANDHVVGARRQTEFGGVVTGIGVRVLDGNLVVLPGREDLHPRVRRLTLGHYIETQAASSPLSTIRPLSLEPSYL